MNIQKSFSSKNISQSNPLLIQAIFNLPLPTSLHFLSPHFTLSLPHYFILSKPKHPATP